MVARVAILAVLLPFATACAPAATPAPHSPAPVSPSPPIVVAVAPATPDRPLPGVGGEKDGALALVASLDGVPAEPPDVAWNALRAIFTRLGALGDPRAADGLVRWAAAAPRAAHWKGEVGARLGELGDLRAVPFLAERLRLSPADVYSPKRAWEADDHGPLWRTDVVRVVAARLLAEVALLHPEAREAIRASAEDAVVAWATGAPLPHANALRFLAAVGSPRGITLLRGWAFPPDPLPALGAEPPFPAAFETAQSGLRYLGAARDEPSFERIVAQLGRKPKALDITQQGLMAGGVALQGMALRALGYGAAQALAHLGDPRARKPLIALIEDETWNEDVRLAACQALAFAGDDASLADVSRKIKSFASRPEAPKQLIAACYASTAAARPSVAAVPALVDLLASAPPPAVQIHLARAIGAGGLTAADEARLFTLVGDPHLGTSAAVALLLGGSPAMAVRACAAVSAVALDALQEAYTHVFGAWTAADLESGSLLRWVENAEALGAASPPQPWAPRILAARLADLRSDSGPRTLTRVAALHRLLDIARTGEPAARRGAVATLAMLQARGALAALADEPGDTGQLARARLAASGTVSD
jgi:HEAT repeat protein